MVRCVGLPLTLLRVAVVIMPVATGGVVLAQGPCLVAKLAPGDADVELGLGDGFGSSAAMDVDTIVIGASRDRERAQDSGAAYVFVRQGEDWIEQAKLIGSAAAFNDAFGSAVEVDGDRIIVGMPHSDPAGPQPGEAYIFQRTGGIWVEQARLIPSVSNPGNFFGRSVDIEGDVAIVGAFQTRIGDDFPGGAFIFRWTGTEWIEEQAFLGSTPSGRFGDDVSVSGTRVAIGESRSDDLCPSDPGCNSGTVHLYAFDGTNWTRQTAPAPFDLAALDHFGERVLIDGDLLFASSPRSEGPGTLGAVYVFRFDGIDWVEDAKLTSTRVTSAERFGEDFAFDSNRLLVGSLFGPTLLYRFISGSWNEMNFAVKPTGPVGLSGALVLSASRVYALDSVVPCIPALSEWGVLVLAILLVTGATLCLRRRRSVASQTYSKGVSMTKRSGIQLWLLVFFPALALSDPALYAQPASAGGPDLAVPHHPEQMLVRFKSHVTPTDRQNIHAQLAGEELRAYRHVSGLVLVKVPAARLAAALDAYAAHADVLYAEPNYRLEFAAVPNDPQFVNNQWGLTRIRAPEAWDVTTGDPTLKIAIIDTGVDYLHPDLAARMWTNPGETPGDGIDNDGNGYVDDIHGYDFSGDVEDEDGDPYPVDAADWHGTHVAGIVAAATNNGVGVAGVTWQGQIVAIRIDAFDSTMADAVQAMDYVIDNNIKLSNNSYVCFPCPEPLSLRDAIEASQAIGHIYVAAAGNNAVDNDGILKHYPASIDLPNIVSVAATEQFNDRLWSSSAFGQVSVDIGAPGTGVTSTSWAKVVGDPIGTHIYQTKNGTSMAAPHVTGVLALVIAQNPSWTYQQVIARVLDTARQVDDLRCKVRSGGVLDAIAALGDCNVNGIDDAVDVAQGTSSDCNWNDWPDECEFDCNNNGQPDACEYGQNCDKNCFIDECDIAMGACDFDNNGVLDRCEHELSGCCFAAVGNCVNQMDACHCASTGGQPMPFGESCSGTGCLFFVE